MMVQRLFPALGVVLLSACGSAAMLASDCIRDGLLSGEGCASRDPPPGDHVTAQPTYDVGDEAPAAAPRSLETVERIAPETPAPADPPGPDEEPPPAGPPPLEVSDARFPACTATACVCVPGSCDEGTCDTGSGACTFDFEFAVTDSPDDAVQVGGDLYDDDEVLEVESDDIAWFRFTQVALPSEAILEDVRLQLFHVGDDPSGAFFTSYLQFERSTHAVPFASLPPLLRSAWTSGVEWEAAPFQWSWIESPDLTDQFKELRALGGLERAGASVLLSLWMDPLAGIFDTNELWALSSTGEEDGCLAVGCAPRLVGRYRVAFSAP